MKKKKWIKIGLVLLIITGIFMLFSKCSIWDNVLGLIWIILGIYYLFKK